MKEEKGREKVKEAIERMWIESRRRKMDRIWRRIERRWRRNREKMEREGI